LTETNHIDFIGNDSLIVLNNTESSPVENAFGNPFPFNYSASDTNSAQQNYATACVDACGATTLTFSACGSMNATDTYFRLFSGSTLVAENNDYCGVASEIVYTVPGSPSDCGSFCLHMGCAGPESCNATVSANYTTEPAPRFLFYERDPAADPSLIPSLTISGGTFSGFGDTIFPGGTMYLDGSAILILSNVSFVNSTGTAGGAVYIGSNSLGVSMRDCTFSACSATYGGGLYLGNNVSNFGSSGSTFTACAASSDGGGLYISDNSEYVILSYLRFDNCTANYAGGGLYMNDYNSHMSLSDITASGCTADSGGFAYFHSFNYLMRLSNMTVSDCVAASSGGGIYLFQNNLNATLSDMSFYYCHAGSNRYGGGVYLNSFNDFFLLTDSYAQGCSANRGGFIYLYRYNDFVAVRDVTMRDGWAIVNAGAVYLYQYNHNATLADLSFYGCGAGTYGGGMYIYQFNEHLTVTGFRGENCFSVRGGFAFFYQGNLNMEMTRSSFVDCVASADGGGLYISEGNHNATLVDVDFEDCSASELGGGLHVFQYNDFFSYSDSSASGCRAQFGGFVYFHQFNQNSAVRNVSVAACEASVDGGGAYVFQYNNDMIVTGVNITDCVATGNGGCGLINKGNARLTVSNATFSGCTARDGGGLYANTSNSNLAVRSSSFSYCVATGGSGGGLRLDLGNNNAWFSDITITDSSASGNGGAFLADQSNVQLVLRGVVIQRCLAMGYGGGGIYWGLNNNGTIVDSVVEECKATYGSSIFLEQRNTLSLIDSAIENCSTSFVEAGLYVADYGTDVTLSGVTMAACSVSPNPALIINVTYAADAVSSTTDCYPATTALCNLRSAFDTCDSLSSNSQPCVVNIAPGLSSEFNSALGQLTMSSYSNIAIWGQDSVITVNQSAWETPLKRVDDGSFPVTYTAVNTADCTQNYASACVTACGGTTLVS